MIKLWDIWNTQVHGNTDSKRQRIMKNHQITKFKSNVVQTGCLTIRSCFFFFLKTNRDSSKSLQLKNCVTTFQCIGKRLQIVNGNEKSDLFMECN